ncbi:MAG TPA: helix-turn-helix transcriptional regulator [Terriglobales bacterium]|nr:helix-turn-helix transcriptional regulator [Terriglobales bacterium]
MLKKQGRPSKWDGPFAEWMEDNGIRADALADEVGVDLSTVYSWLRGDTFPARSKALLITEIARRSGSRRKLTLEDILNPRPKKSLDEEQINAGVLPRPTSQAINRRMATATK